MLKDCCAPPKDENGEDFSGIDPGLGFPKGDGFCATEFPKGPPNGDVIVDALLLLPNGDELVADVPLPIEPPNGCCVDSPEEPNGEALAPVPKGAC